MKNKLLVCICALAVISSAADKIYACCQNPVASFSGPTSVYCGDEATFTCTSTDADSAISSRSWSASGGTPSTGNGSSFTTKWCTAGSKTVSLTVWDSDASVGCPPNKDDTEQKNVTVLPVEVASVTAYGETCVGCTITFTATTNPGGKYECVEWTGGGTPATGSGETFTTSWSTAGTKTVTASCCGSSMQEQVAIVEVTSVTSDKDAACVGCDITFTVTTNPPGYEYVVSWGGGGIPSSQYGGATFTTRWTSSGAKTVTAECYVMGCSGESESKQVTMAEPTNLHQHGPGVDIGDGVLIFHYKWDSTSGILADLSGCEVGEKVDYPGGNPYDWPSPPWSGSTDNPTVGGEDATRGEFWDMHSSKPFVPPYQAASFSATQIYRYDWCGGPPYNTLLGPHSIDRSVFADPSCTSGWRYKVEKTGSSADTCLP